MPYSANVNDDNDEVTAVPNLLGKEENNAHLVKKRKADVLLSTTPSSPTTPPTSFNLYVKRLSEKAILPVRGSSQAAGYDLHSARDIVVPAKGKALIPTDLSISIPLGTYGRVAPRSGLALNHFLDCGAGVIDPDYRGPVGVLLFNFSDNDYKVKEGDRIAQLILERIFTPKVVEVEKLEETDRGEGGFGSTGFR